MDCLWQGHFPLGDDRGLSGRLHLTSADPVIPDGQAEDSGGAETKSQFGDMHFSISNSI